MKVKSCLKICHKSKSLLQRVGYLVELLALPASVSFRDLLLANLGNNTCYLGQPSRWPKGGEFNRTWNVVDNVPRRELLAEIEIST